MKKARLATIVVAVLMMSSVLSVNAQRAVNIEVIPYVKEMVWFNVSGLDKAQQFQVKIQNEQGELLFSETFKNQDQYKKVLDFSIANKGTYYVDLVNDYSLIRKVIKVGEGQLVNSNFKYATEDTKVLSREIHKIGNDKYAIKFENSLGIPISFAIRDNEGNLLHSEKDIDTTYAKLYNLSNLESGDYSMVISAKNYTSYYSVNLGK